MRPHGAVAHLLLRDFDIPAVARTIPSSMRISVGLPGPLRPTKGVHITEVDLEGDVVDGHDLAVASRHAANGDGGRAHG